MLLTIFSDVVVSHLFNTLDCPLAANVIWWRFRGCAGEKPRENWSVGHSGELKNYLSVYGSLLSDLLFVWRHICFEIYLFLTPTVLRKLQDHKIIIAFINFGFSSYIEQNNWSLMSWFICVHKNQSVFSVWWCYINKEEMSLLIQQRGVIKIDTPPSETSLYVLSSPLL